MVRCRPLTQRGQAAGGIQPMTGESWPDLEPFPAARLLAEGGLYRRLLVQSELKK